MRPHDPMYAPGPAVHTAGAAAFGWNGIASRNWIYPAFQPAISILDDHFENLYRNLMPTFAIGIADAHAGPADYWRSEEHTSELQSLV